MILNIEVPERFFGIPKVYLTQKYEMFILGQTVDGYEMHRIDLDSFEDRINKKGRKMILNFDEPEPHGSLVMKYSYDEVDNGAIVDFHVRAATSVGKDIILDKIVFAFFIHKGSKSN